MASSASSTNALLALKNQQASEIAGKSPYHDAGGPKLDDAPVKIGSTADYANYAFDATAGVKADTTIRSNAVTGNEPEKEKEEDITAKAPALTPATPASKPEKLKTVPPSSQVTEEAGDDVNLDFELDELHDSNVDLIDLPEAAGLDDVSELDEDDDSDEDDEPKFRNEAHAREVYAQLKGLFESEDETEGKRDDDMEEIPTGDDDAPSTVTEGFLDDEDDDEEDEDEKEGIEEAKIENGESLEEEVEEPKTFKMRIKFAEGKQLFEGNTVLSEEDIRQSRALFESAVRSTATDIAKQLQEEYQKRYVAAKLRNEARTAERVDKYLSYVVETWAKENEVALKSQLRSRLTENFITGLRDLFVENYIDIPESQVDVVTALSRSVKELKSQLRESEEAKLAMHTEMTEQIERERKALVTEHKARLIAEAASALPAVDRGAFTERANTLEFKESKDFRKDLIALREQYKAADKSSKERSINVPVAAPLLESNEVKGTKGKTRVSSYSDALAKLSR